MSKFEFDAFIEKVYKNKNGKMIVVAVASDSDVDRTGDAMSEHSIHEMVKQSKKGLPLLPSHQSSFAFGRSINANARENKKDKKILEFVTELELDPLYPQSQTLFKELQSGICDKQLSIGGFVSNKDILFEEKNGEIVRIIDNIKLDHIAVTRNNFAANPRTSFINAIFKSIDSNIKEINIKNQDENSNNQNQESENQDSDKRNKISFAAVAFRSFPLQDKDFGWKWDKEKDINDILTLATNVITINDFNTINIESKKKGWLLVKDSHALWKNANEIDSIPFDKMSYFLPHHKAIGNQLMTVFNGIVKQIDKINNWKEDEDLKHFPVEVIEVAKKHLILHLQEYGLNESDLENIKGDKSMHKKESIKEKEVLLKDIVSFKSYPLAPSDTEWRFGPNDGNSILIFASKEQDIESFLISDEETKKVGYKALKDVNTYFDSKADPDHPDVPFEKQAYALPHHKLLDGKILTVQRGVMFAASSINGARGGFRRVTDDEERRRLYNHLVSHSREFKIQLPPLRPFGKCITENVVDKEYCEFFVKHFENQNINMDWFKKEMEKNQKNKKKEKFVESENEIKKTVDESVDKKVEKIEKTDKTEKNTNKKVEKSEKVIIEKDTDKKSTSVNVNIINNTEDTKVEKMLDKLDKLIKKEIPKEKNVDKISDSFEIVKKSLQDMNEKTECLFKDLIKEYKNKTKQHVLISKSSIDLFSDVIDLISKEDISSLEDIFGGIFEMAKKYGLVIDRNKNEKKEIIKKEEMPVDEELDVSSAFNSISNTLESITGQLQSIESRLSSVEKNVPVSKSLPGQECLSKKNEDENIWENIFSVK